MEHRVNWTRLLPAIAGSVVGVGQASAQPFPPMFELSTLDGSNGFVLNGASASDRSGSSVSSAGDVNGDGVGDLIVGAYGAGPNGSNSGASYVVFGGPGVGAGGVIEFSALDGTNGFVLNGVAVDDVSGFSVSSAGDVNGDGTDDLIVGAFEADPNGSSSGASYVVFGTAGLGAGGVLELSALDGTDGFALNGASAGDYSGISVSSAGDVNGDGTDDLIVGARGADPNGSSSGASYVVFGTAGLGAGGVLELPALDGTDGFVLNGVATYDFSGFPVSCAGDVNGDGTDDLIVGAYFADPNGSRSGASYVVFGAVGLGAGGVLELSALDGTNGFVLNGVAVDDVSGVSVSSAGDVNGDGTDDLIVGAVEADPNGSRSGASYVVFGGAALGAGGVLELSALDGTDGFVLNGASAFDYSGFPVSCAGDVNGDGTDDLIVGAFLADPNGSRSGASYVVFGGVGVGAGGVLELSALDGTDGFVLNGVAANDYSGRSVSSAGDVNGDGTDDLIVGARGADPNGSRSGASYVVFGRRNNTWISPNDGLFDDGENWFYGAPPIAGSVFIETHFGVTVTAPSRAVFFDELCLGAVFGRTTLSLVGDSLMSVDTPFLLPASAGLTGSGGTFVAPRLTAMGFVRLDAGMGLVVPDGVTTNAGAELAATDGTLFGDLTNRGLITLDATGSGSADLVIEGDLLNGARVVFDAGVQGSTRLSVDGALTNAGGAEMIVRGRASIETMGGLTNRGDVNLAFSEPTIAGPIINEIFRAGFALNGVGAGDSSGGSVSSAGDVNGDGVDDLIIGAGGADPNGSISGASYVVFGGDGAGAVGAFELSSLDGTNGFVVNGVAGGDNAGAVSAAGDVNGDGIDDLIIGASGVDTNGSSAGASYVVFGDPLIGGAGVLELSALTGANGFVLNGVAAQDSSGRSVSCAGDVSGDGIDDLLIGTIGAGPNSAGEAYVVFGALDVGATGSLGLSTLDGSNGFVLLGGSDGDIAGRSVSAAGDVNDDGVDDIIIGATGVDPNGAAYVVFGGVGVGSSGSIALSALDGSDGFSLELAGVQAPSAYAGRSVSSAGDVNGDGIDDVIVGAYFASNGSANAGAAYVVFGAAEVGTGGTIQLGDLDGTDGFVMRGLGTSSYDLLGGACSSAGDLNGDGVGDIVVGAFGANDSAGATYVIFGAPGVGTGGAVDLAALDGTDGVVINGAGLIRSGVSLGSGDFNADGFADIIIGADSASPNGPSSGASFVIFGATAWPASIELDELADLFEAGFISVSGGSDALFTDDVHNESTVVLTDDSCLVILGTLSGNGVQGPGGPGTAGCVFVEGGVLPGFSPGRASFDGDLGLGFAGTTVLEIGGLAPGTQHDQIAVAGTIGAGGTLRIELINGYVAQPGDSFALLEFDELTGGFSDIILPQELIDLGVDPSSLVTGGTLDIPSDCPADLVPPFGALDIFDIIAYLGLFEAMDPAADLVPPFGGFDIFDIIEYLALFDAGCP